MSAGSSDLPPPPTPPPPPPPPATPSDGPPPNPPGGPVGGHRTVNLPQWPFVRSDTDRYLGGVAGGMAERLDVDPLFIRVGLVAGTLLMRNELHAVLPLVYLATWLIVPVRAGRSLVGTIRTRSSTQEAVLAVGVTVLSITILGNSSLIVPGTLLAIAAALLTRSGGVPRDDEPEWSGDDPEPEGPGTPGHGPPRPPAAQEQEAKAARWGRSLRRGVAERSSDRERPPRKPRRQPALWPMTFALLFMLAVVAVLVDNSVSGGLDPAVVVNGALLIIGAVIVVAGWRGRAKMTALLVLPLIPPWIAFSVADVGRFDGEGLLELRPSGITGEGLRFERGYGALDIDLTDLTLAAGSETSVEISVTAGTARVVVPHETEVQVRAHVGLGLYRVTAPRSFLRDEEPASDRTFNRTYPALGTQCEVWSVTAEGIESFARASGIALTDAVDAEAVADAIALAGYERPTHEFTEVWSHSGRLLFDADGRPLSGLVGPLPPDAVFRYEDNQPVESTDVARLEYWSVRNDGGNELCVDVEAPPDPARIVIDATLGLGNLEIIRD